MWDTQFPVFAQHYRVLRFDWRGFGKTARPDMDFSHHADLQALLTALGIDKAIVLGVSMGGSEAIDLALEHPERVEALMLVGSGVQGFEGDDAEALQQWDAMVAAFNAGDFERTAELETHMWFDGPKRTPDQVDPQLRALVKEMLLITYPNEKHGKSLPPATHALSRLGEIDVPTLVMFGDYDVTDMSKIADALAAGIPGAKKVVMHGVAHLPNMEQPEEFNRIVLDFLHTL